MPVLQATTQNSISQLADQVASFANTYASQLANQVASYQAQASQWANQVAQYSQNTTQYYANQVAQVPVIGAPLLPPPTPAEIAAINLAQQQRLQQTQIPQLNLSSFDTSSLTAQINSLANLANQVAAQSRNTPSLDPALLQSIINQLPSLITSANAQSINPLISSLNNYTNQSAAQMANLVASFSSQINTLSSKVTQTNNSSLSEFSRIIENLTEQSSELQGSSVSAISQIVNAYNQSLSSAISSESIASQQSFEAQSSRIDTLEQELTRIAETASGSEPITAELISDVIGTSAVDILPKVTDMFKTLNLDIFSNIFDFLSMIGDTIETQLKEIDGRLKGALEKLKTNQYKSFDEFTRDLFGTGVTQDIGTLVFSLVMFLPLVMDMFRISGLPISRALHTLINRTTPNEPLTLDNYLAYFIRGNKSEDDLADLIAQLGISKQETHKLVIASQRPMPEDVAKTLFLRGEISAATLDLVLIQNGYSQLAREAIPQTLSLIPPIQDIITMSVREVFSPKDRQDLGLDGDFPVEVEQWAKKQGLSTEWARNYWAAHWQLPSPQMGFEMFHRGIISYDRLKQLLKALDYTQVWRDELIQLSYNPVTRVDIRRMYKQGNINYDEMVKRHKAIGLSPDDAKLLSDFVVSSITDDDDKYTSSVRTRVFNSVERAYENGDLGRDSAINAFMVLQLDRDTAESIVNLVDYEKSVLQKVENKKTTYNRTVNAVLSAYRKGSLPRSQASFFLYSFFPSQQEIDTELNFVDLERTILIKSKMEEAAKKQYINYTINQVEMYAMLDGLQFTPQEKYFIWLEADMERKNRTKKLTEKQLEKLFMDGIISTEQYKDELRGLGYADKYVEWLLIQDIVAMGA